MALGPLELRLKTIFLKITRGFNSRQIRLLGFNVQAEPHAARWELTDLQFNFFLKKRFLTTNEI